jgi:ABC-type transport system substrate-binding protein
VPWQSFAELEAAGATLFTNHGLMSFVRLHQASAPLDNKLVRQALAYVLDRDAINQLAFGGRGIPMTGPLQPPGSPYYFSDLEGTYTQDWDKAIALLAEAGVASPEDLGTLDFQVSTSALSQQPGKVVQEQMQQFGVTLEFRTIDVPTLNQNRANGTYVVHQDGLGMAWPDPDYLRYIFHSEFGQSHAVGVSYKNERLDELLEQGAQTSDVEQRKTIYREAEQIILDEVPWIFILWRPQTEAVAEHVKGYQLLPNGLQSYQVDRMENVWLDS